MERLCLGARLSYKCSSLVDAKAWVRHGVVTEDRSQDLARAQRPTRKSNKRTKVSKNMDGRTMGGEMHLLMLGCGAMEKHAQTTALCTVRPQGLEQHLT